MARVGADANIAATTGNVLYGTWHLCLRVDRVPPLAGRIVGPEACGELRVSAARVPGAASAGDPAPFAATYALDLASLLGDEYAGRDRCGFVALRPDSTVNITLAPSSCDGSRIIHDDAVDGTGRLRGSEVGGDWAVWCDGCSPMQAGSFTMRRLASAPPS